MPISIERERIAPCHALQHAPAPGRDRPTLFRTPPRRGLGNITARNYRRVLQHSGGGKISGSIYHAAPAPRLRPPPPVPRWGCAVSPCRAPPAADLRASPASPAAADLHRSPAPWWAGWLARMAGMVAGLVCQSSVNGQSRGRAARMRFAGGFSPEGQGQGREAERQPRAKQGAETGRKTGRNRKAGKKRIWINTGLPKIR
jgi:hypothetical protein